jgi:hypothetical protein
MEDNNLSAQIKRIIEQLKVYIDLRVGLLKLNVAEYVIRFFSSLVLWMVVFLFLFFVLVFSSFAFAYWYGERTGKWSLGFLIIAGFYVLLAALIFVLRNPIIIKPFTRLIISHLELDQDNDKGGEDEK